MDSNSAPIKVQRLIKTASVALLIYIVIYYGLLLLLKPDQDAVFSDLMSPVGMLISLLFMYRGIKHHNKREQKIWIMFFLGTLLFVMGDIQFSYNELVKKDNNLFPSSADIFYVLSGITLLIAFFLHIPQKSKFSALRSSFDILIIMVVYLTLETRYILTPVMTNKVLDFSEKMAVLFYPVFDAGLFIAIILLYFNNANDQKYFKSKWMILVGATWLFADQIYTVKSVYGVYKSGYWLDPLWAASYIGLAIVTLKSAAFYLNPSDSLDSDVIQEPDERVVKLRIFITYAIMVIFLLIWSLNYFQKEPLSIGGIIIILLVICRQLFSLLENRRLLRQLVKANADLLQANSRIEYELQTDYLTRLYNRRYIDRTLSNIQSSAERNPAQFSILVIDIDHFKQINDQYGHDKGDYVLKHVSELIKANIRAQDIAGRWGGEEFIVLLPNTDENMAHTIGERMRREIENNPYLLNGKHPISLSVSIGISEHSPDEKDFAQVLIRADQGMYEAKNAGRNRSVIKRLVEAV